jgi:glycosyltransferase involved in cell wall biosynthesis
MDPIQPSVSILLPAHNSQRFIEETLVSILSQTFEDFECIVVNDGSTDGTAKIVEKFLSDPRIALVNLPKVGLCAALNHGIGLAKAPLIARMDSDDVMLPERLAQQVAFLRAHPGIGGCGSFYHLINEHGETIGDGRSPLTSVERIRRHLANRGHLIYPHPTIMVRREILVSIGGYRSEYFPCEDVDLFVRMLEINKPVLVMPSYLLHFRVHGSSVSSTNAERQFHANSLIFRNYHARRRGREVIPIEEYLSQLKTASGVKKILNWCQLQSFVLHRKAARAKTNHQNLLGNGLLLLAMALNLRDAYWGVVRRVRAGLH